jgi:hypothetical protein
MAKSYLTWSCALLLCCLLNGTVPPPSGPANERSSAEQVTATPSVQHPSWKRQAHQPITWSYPRLYSSFPRLHSSPPCHHYPVQVVTLPLAQRPCPTPNGSVPTNQVSDEHDTPSAPTLHLGAPQQACNQTHHILHVGLQPTFNEFRKLLQTHHTHNTCKHGARLYRFSPSRTTAARKHYART